MTAEPVRLVIWDLDDTFWTGTLAEDGAVQYRDSHHDIVIELARRGIMSSLCSKNDLAQASSILQARGIWDYFVFPSIDWTPKAERVAAIIEAMRLRAATVLFVDDNPHNLAEAAAHVPGLQTADPAILSGLLDYPLFKGKADRNFVRLAQYKLLERRHADMLGAGAGAGNADFLCRSNIRVTIESDVEAHLDRAVELVNRTNQLNFTKLRLPDDQAAARDELRRQIAPFYIRAGLVHVSDAYGDYGYCGFYCFSPHQIMHYCFSCRILGMGIESWLFEHLIRPTLIVADSWMRERPPDRAVDWVTFAGFGGPAAQTGACRVQIPEIRLRGGCELDAVAHYLKLATERLRIETNRNRPPFFLRCDCTTLLAEAGSPALSDAAADLRDAGYDPSDLQTAFLAPAAPGTVLVYSGWGDPYLQQYRHVETGLAMPVDITGLPGVATEASESLLDRIAAEQNWGAADEAAVRRAVATLGRAFTPLEVPPAAASAAALRRVLDVRPEGATLFVLLPLARGKGADGAIWERHEVPDYNAAVRAVCAGRRDVQVIDVEHLVQSADEMNEGFDHYHRVVYFRIAQEILDGVARQAEAVPPDGPTAVQR